MRKTTIIFVLCFLNCVIYGQGFGTKISIGNAIFEQKIKSGVINDPDKYIHNILIQKSEDGIIKSIDFI